MLRNNLPAASGLWDAATLNKENYTVKLLIGLLTVIVIIYCSSLNWRRSIKAVLFILVIEGALRKWVLPQASDMIYFLKDFVLLGAYLKYYIFSNERKFSIKNNMLTILIFLITGWCLLQAFNPSLGSPIIGIFGLKSYLWYIPLIWMVPNLFQSEDDLYRFLRLYLLLAIPVGVLGIVQFFSPPLSPINLYAPGEVTDVATLLVGGVAFARITGTFSYLDGYAVYLIVCFGLLLPFLFIRQSKWWWLITVANLLLITINSLMTGSRSVVFASALFLLGYLGFKGFTHPSRMFRSLSQFFLPALIISIALFTWFQPAIDAFWLRTTSTQDIPARIANTITQPFEFSQYKDFDGYGAGATHPGGQALRSALNLPNGEDIPVYYEEEPGRVVLELGPIGFVFWYGLRIRILIELWRVFWKLKRPFLRQLALAIFLIQAIQLNDHLVFHHTFSMYYWFLTGFIFLLPRLEKIETWRQNQQNLQQNVIFTYFPGSFYKYPNILLIYIIGSSLVSCFYYLG